MAGTPSAALGSMDGVIIEENFEANLEQVS